MHVMKHLRCRARVIPSDIAAQHATLVTGLLLLYDVFDVHHHMLGLLDRVSQPHHKLGIIPAATRTCSRKHVVAIIG